jgi:uncharacterized membrane protein YozB (DUF420 family)
VSFSIDSLPTLNASLNLLATALLLVGYALIKRRREKAHERVMLAAFGVSVLFLISYLVYHSQRGSVRFQGPEPVRTVYLAILLSHIVLAAIVPVMAGLTIYWGLVDRRGRHVRLARWTLPIWLYVSVTGVAIYLMLYHVYPAGR